jgi:hypothetical protein
MFSRPPRPAGGARPARRALGALVATPATSAPALAQPAKTEAAPLGIVLR